MIDAYLARLGMARPRVPDLDTLFALHRTQVERVPYENIDIYLGKPPGIDPAETFERIARGRGGYCYQLNGAFATLLTDLGYAVTWHVGGVHNEDGPVGATGNHLALTVAGLPSAQNPDGRWFVDAGLGDALHEPLPLREGTYSQGPFTYGLEPSTVIDGGWHFTHTPDASFAGMDFGPIADGPATFAEHHRHLSTSPESSFTQKMVVSQRGPDGYGIVRGISVVRHDARGQVTRFTESKQEWLAALATFPVDLADLDTDALWEKGYADYVAWLASL